MEQNTKKRPYLLLSNDDGYDARGLQTLIECLRPACDLLVVAPDGPRSGFSASISSRMPIASRLVSKEPGLTIYATSGTPVDCVKLGLNRYVERTPDLVVSGINHGDNASVNAHYSGTMGAAGEGALQGLPAVAFSLCDTRPDADFEPLKPYLLPFVLRAIEMGMPPFTCWNINFPKAPSFKGVRIGRMAKSRWVEEIEDCDHPRYKNAYYWLAGYCEEMEPEADDTDRWALYHDYIALTPTALDNTDYALLRALQSDFTKKPLL